MQNKKCDFLIIGGGIAGLRAALYAAPLCHTVLLTKTKIGEGESATSKAQGGIAAAINQPKDSPRYHYQDTIAAGAGLCDPKAVKVLVEDGVARVKELIEMGAKFDKGEAGFELTIEGAHRQRRILHAGDSTGEEIERALGRSVIEQDKTEIMPLTFAQELLTSSSKVIGAVAINDHEPIIIQAKATLIATGGLGQVYLYTTNPLAATGDGIAMAYRAGAQVMDMEFVQFHPTALVRFKKLEDIIALPQFLISEAVRGEGGILLNSHGERFMEKYHVKLELAPRDIVARAIVQEMKDTNAANVFLSLAEIAPEKIVKRFPGIYKTCLERGLDITREPIPVAPAAHYAMGGIKTDTDGKTNLPGLYAAGETTSLGIHGANRLASNSLLDGLVFGCRAAKAAITYLKTEIRLKLTTLKTGVGKSGTEIDQKNIRQQLKERMWGNVGIIRDGVDLKRTLEQFNISAKETCQDTFDTAELELQNMLLVAQLIIRAALDRKESRGAHYRVDFPKTDDKKWKRHLVYKI